MRSGPSVQGWLTALVGLALTTGSVSNARPFGSSFGIPGVPATYDYIVVGGGTAGLTLASRLVEQAAGNVAIVEDGTFYELSNGNLSEVPSWAVYWNGKALSEVQPLADWGYETTPQAGADNLVMHYPRGKMLGGSSGRNYMIYHRPTTGSMQMWADKVGDASYEFDNFLPYFEKSITFTPENKKLRLANASTTYSTATLKRGSGPLHVTFANWVYAFPTWAAKAMAKTLRIPFHAEGFQDGGLLGYAYTMYTVDPTTALRSSSETAFLRPSLDAGEPNLYVYPLTLAKRVLFDDSKKASGVLVQTATANYTLTARKEVILAAGVIGSPQLLQVSGVGDADLVASLGVPLVADLPGVGQNFQDQILFGVTHAVNAITASAYDSPGYIAEQAALFDTKAAGQLTSVGADMLGFEKVSGLQDRNSTLSPATQAAFAAYPPDWPELEYIIFSGYGGDGSTFTGADPGDGKQYATMTVVLVAPQSRGNITAFSADTAVQPEINPAYLTAQADIEVAVAGFKRARQFWGSNALDGFVVGNEEAYPGAGVVTDDQIASAIRQGFQTIYHGSCTCAMGPANDTMAVVDTQARVYGVQGLRVVDASAFPFLPPGHPQSVVYALAEKIACDISGNC